MEPQKYKLAIPPLDTLCSVQVQITKKFESAAKCGPSRQIEFSRLIVAYSKGTVLATPHQSDQLVLTMPRDYYESGQIGAIVSHLGLTIQIAGQVDRETLRTALCVWITYCLTPRFCLVNYNFFFLNNDDHGGSGVYKPQPGTQAEKPGAMLELFVHDGYAELMIKPCILKMTFPAVHKMKRGQTNVCVMPKMTNASVKGIIEPKDFENEPRRMKWKDLRRYWRRVHGFILPEKAEPCVMVEFYRGRPLQYPLSTVLDEKPKARSIDSAEQRDTICNAFVQTLTKSKNSLFSTKPELKRELKTANSGLVVPAFGENQNAKKIRI